MLYDFTGKKIHYCTLRYLQSVIINVGLFFLVRIYIFFFLP